jgi:acyl-[acyl-carrier-protein]-phospholipid O-acyltransferase / long-chain-fatty-acid--[acyl-carrier-protein] ligase
MKPESLGAADGKSGGAGGQRRPLLAERRFAPLFWCQFFSAFNDNFLKNALLFLILWGTTGAGGAGQSGSALVTLAGAFFIAPFFLLSALGGELADRLDKALLAQRLKLAEMAASALAVLGFLMASVPILFAALFVFGTISALFGPVKYGILPDHLPRDRLTAANALVEFATFLAILGGTVAGGLAVAIPGGRVVLAVTVVVFAVLSWLAARLIPPTGEAAPELRVRRNIFASTWGLARDLRQDSRIWRASLATSWFWMVGAIALALLPAMVRNVLGGETGTATIALVAFSVGIGVGSGLAAWLAGGRIVLLPAVIGMALMGVFLIDLWWVTHGLPIRTGILHLFPAHLGHVLVDLVGLSAAGGLLVVPTFAAVQAWAGPERRARVVGGVNVISAAAMAAGALVVALAQKLGAGEPVLLGAMGLGSLTASGVMLARLPTEPTRDLLWMLLRLLYRIEVTGAENIAKAGPRSLVALNHVSWLDAGVALALVETSPVFAIDAEVARKWWVRPLLRLGQALPLDPARPFATRVLIHAVAAGSPVVIFPEGRITVTGSLMKVYDGAAMVADKSDAMIVPVRIDGLEKSLFSRLAPEQVRRRLFPRLRVTVLPPQPLVIDSDLRGRPRRVAGGAALYRILSELVFATSPTDRTLFQAVAAAAREHGRKRVAVQDPTSGTMSYGRLLTGAAVLGRALAPLAPEGEAVGVLMPNANATAALIIGLVSAGRVPAMLNFTAGPANILAACRAARIGTIVTSRAFVEKGQLDRVVAAIEAGADEVHPKLLYLEDLRKSLGTVAKLRGLLQGGRPLVRRLPDDPAVILFTSGSEGMPKGVVLSHRNILANIAQAAARIDFGRGDRLFNVLPVFHSFGLSCGLMLPLAYGVPVYLYPSPLHYRLIPELVYGCNATIMFGTDTFLAGYARTANPYDFRSLRYVVAGAEPVRPVTRAVYLEKFGLRLLEGYGVTETSPVLALNTPMFNRFGTVGQLLPGIEARLAPVPGIENAGRLQVRGPNVMLGYLRFETPGVIEPPQDGWYDTGDIVSIDSDGYVTIRGRARRFAKIGGEMISLAAVEILAGELWPEAIVAVAAIPDAKKGERLILFTNHEGATRGELTAHARAHGATELMVPAEVRVVEAVPLLGSGKVDGPAVQRLADEVAAGDKAA